MLFRIKTKSTLSLPDINGGQKISNFEVLTPLSSHCWNIWMTMVWIWHRQFETVDTNDTSSDIAGVRFLKTRSFPLALGKANPPPYFDDGLHVLQHLVVEYCAWLWVGQGHSQIHAIGDVSDDVHRLKIFFKTWENISWWIDERWKIVKLRKKSQS